MVNLSSDHFEALVEGMCDQVRGFPHEKVAFWGHPSLEVVLTIFAVWKVGKIACPLNFRLPSAEPALQELGTELFTPQMPEPKTVEKREWDFSKIGALLFTSGSSGKPKIAALSLENLVLHAQGANSMLPLEPTDSWALTLPLFHVGGLGILLRCYLAKCSITFNVEEATHLSLVPTQLFRLLKEDKKLPRLKTILLGGAPLPDIATPWNIAATYGMTEMCSQIVTGNKVHPYAEVKIGPDQEIFVRGAVLFQGYYEKGKITLPLQEGWFATKDLGRWENEKFQILGRKDNLFISGGENIQPEEIEAVIGRVCGLEAVVVPIPDGEFGARPGVFLKDPSILADIQHLLKPHLPKYKIPIKAFLMPELTGLKPSRTLLGSMALTQNKQ